MSLLRRLLPERRDLTFQSLWASGQEIPDSRSVTGVKVTTSNATRLAAVFSCVRLLADLVSTLPVDVVRGRGEERERLPLPMWLTQPVANDPNLSRINHFQQVVTSLLLDGNAFVFTNRDGGGGVLEVIVLDPTQVEIKSSADQRRRYLVGAEQTQAGPEEIIHIPLILRGGQLRGMSPIEEIRQAVELGLAAEEYGGRQFGQGVTLPGAIEVEGTLKQEQKDEIRERTKRHHGGLKKMGAPLVLEGGAKWKPIGITNEQAQFLQTRQYQRQEIAGIYRVPAFLIGDTSPGAVSYASVEMQMESLRINTVQPLVSLLEAAYDRLLPSGTVLKFNANAIVRPDIAQRYQAYSVALQSGFTTVDRINALEDLPPLPGGDVLRVPLALASAEDADMAKKVEMLGSLIRAGFKPAAATKHLGLPDIAHTGLEPITVSEQQ